MKRTKWIFAALCILLAASVSAVASLVGGVQILQNGTNRNISVPVQNENDKWLHDVESATLYGSWDNVEMGIWGKGDSSGKMRLDLIISGDFDFKKTDRKNGGFSAHGGRDNYNTTGNIAGDTKLVVTGDKNAIIDLDNGGISLYGGGSFLSDQSSGDILGSTTVELKGESPKFILDPEVDDNISFFGGSSVSHNNTHTIHGDSAVLIDSPWNMGDDDNDISFVVGGSEAWDDAKIVTKGKTYIRVNHEKASATNIRGGGRVFGNAFCIIEGGSELLLEKGSIGNSYAGCYVSQNAKAYTANTYVEIRDINAPSNAMVTGGGVSGSNSDLDDADMRPLSVVSGDTKILIEPSANYTGRGVWRIFGGSNIRGVGATAEVLGSTNIIISGDAALDVIKPQNTENDWTHISAGSFRKSNKAISNDVKGDGNITFKNIKDISKLMNNTALSGQGRERDENMPGNLGFYNNSVAGTSRLIYDNVKGITGARTFNFDEIIFKGESSVTFNRSLSQLMDAADDKETVKLIVEKGSTLRIVKDPTGDTGDPILGNAKIDGTLIIEDGMTLILNNSLEKGEGATVEGNIVVRKVNPEEPPIKPDDVNVIPVKPETVKSVDDLPAGVPALVEKQPNGDIVVTSAKFAAAVASSDVNGTVDTNLIKSIPVFKTVVSADKTALASFRGRLDEFSSHKFKDIVLCKVIPGKVLKFAFQSLPKKIESGEFAITTADGAAVEANASPKAGVEYLISFAVADNSEYDLDKTKGNILDPAVLSVNQYRLTLSATELLLAEGQSKTLTASGIAPGATLEWESSNDKVAAIEGSGEEITVKALSAGKANITVTDGSVTVTCRVTVTKGGSGGSSGGGCNSGLAAVVLAAFIPLFFRRKSKAVH